MLDFFTIFNKRGIVLFSYPTTAKLPGAPVDRLVRDVLLEERSGENSYSLDNYALKWTFANEFDLIFVAVYQKIFSLLYLDELLELVKQSFVEIFKGLVPPGTPPSSVVTQVPFDEQFLAIFDKVETTSKKRPFVQKRWEETDKAKDIVKSDDGKKKKKDKKKKGDPNSGDGGDEQGDNKDDKKGAPQDPSSGSEVDRKRQNFIAKQLGLKKKDKDKDKPKEEKEPAKKRGNP